MAPPPRGARASESDRLHSLGLDGPFSRVCFVHPDETIVALASPPAAGARAIVRLSGPHTVDVLSRVFTPSDPAVQLRTARRAQVIPGSLRLAVEPARDLPLSLYYWPDGRSYTRQSSAELHLVGSPPLVDACIHTLCRAGGRLAEPGEFTLRAFLAGRIDLTQAEAVLGVIDAPSREALDLALAQLAGGLSLPLSRLRNELLNLLADLEAGLDFADEDILFVTRRELQARLADAADQVARLAAQLDARRERSDLAKVAVVGRPNVGKSSLINALACRAASLVSDVPGTTRDLVVATLALGPLRCQLVDTAGIDEAARPESIDAQAQQQAREQNRQAGLRLVCIDSTRPLDDWEREQIAGEQSSTIIVMTKCDLAPHAHDSSFGNSIEGIRTSAITGAGLAKLRQKIAAQLASLPVGDTALAVTALRCQDSLNRAGDALSTASALAASEQGEELVAVHLRSALDEIGRVTGAVYTDDILDRVFSRFCIGK